MSAKIFVDNLNSKDRMAIVTDNVELLCDFTRDKELLKEKLESLKKRMLMRKFGQSRQYSALTAAVNELFGPEDVRRIVIFQTDGDQVNLKAKPFDFDEMLLAVEKSRAVVYSVFPGLRYEGLTEKEKTNQAKTEYESFSEKVRDKSNFDLMSKSPELSDRNAVIHAERVTKQQLALDRTARSSGGWMEYIRTPVDADRVYSRILEGINRRYVVGYYPKNSAKDGKRRVMNVEVKDHPEYQIEGRKTYFAAGPENSDK